MTTAPASSPAPELNGVASTIGFIPGGFARLAHRVLDNYGEKLGAVGLLVYWAVVRHADRDGRAWPSVSTIARKTTLSRRAVQKSLRKLEKAHLITRDTGGQDGKASTYQVVWKIPDPQPDPEEGGAPGAQGGASGAREGAHHMRPNKNQSTRTKNNTPPTPKGGRRVRASSTRTEDDGFATFWAAYPRKEAENAALKAWRKLADPQLLLPTILAAVEEQKRSDEWQRERGRYIPRPGKWLREGHWTNRTTNAVGPATNQVAEERLRQAIAEREEENRRRANKATTTLSGRNCNSTGGNDQR